MTSSATEVAAFSSRGNVGIGVEGEFGRYKPDLMAPGTFVISTRSLEWDERAYYNPTSHIVDVLDVTILTNRAFTNLISFQTTRWPSRSGWCPTERHLPPFQVCRFSFARTRRPVPAIPSL